jgi:nucleoside-diphosphate-sugar epimerase
MKLFVTGGTGFVGSYFINYAAKDGHELICLRRPGSIPRIRLEKEPAWIDGKLDGNWKEILKNCDVLVHLASTGVSPQATTNADLFRVNVQASYKLLLDAQLSGVRKYIITGSSSEYGLSSKKYNFIPTDAMIEPSTTYAASKASFLQLLYGFSREEKLNVIYARIFSAFGEGQFGKNLWPSMRKAALKGENFPMTLGEQVRDFIPVEDVAKQLVTALSFSNVNSGCVDVRNIGTGVPQTLREFAEYWWQKWEAKGELQIGEIPYRKNEIMRFVPEIKK